jgi:hypothetical protein
LWIQIDARHCACLANLNTVATAVGTVTDNDLLNGVAVTANTDVTPITTGPLSYSEEFVDI